MAELTELGKNACAAKYILQKLTTEEKNKHWTLRQLSDAAAAAKPVPMPDSIAAKCRSGFSAGKASVPPLSIHA